MHLKMLGGQQGNHRGRSLRNGRRSLCMTTAISYGRQVWREFLLFVVSRCFLCKSRIISAGFSSLALLTPPASTAAAAATIEQMATGGPQRAEADYRSHRQYA